MGKLAANFLKTARPGKYSDGAGLYLLVTGREEGGQIKGSWIFRYTHLKQRYEMGLGSAQNLSLAQARSERDRWRDLMTDRRSPMNPLEEKRRLESEAENSRKGLTLSEVAPMAFESLKGSLRDEGKAGRWFSPLRLHVLPALGAMPIEEIRQRDIEKALQPIWKAKPATAKKAIQRLGVVLKHGAAMGLDVNLNAVVNARQLLGNQDHQVQHHPALPWREIPKLYQSLLPANAVHRALMLYILVGGGPRLRPVRYATFDQFSGGVWEIDGELMKGRKGKSKSFRIPLTTRIEQLVHASKQKCISPLLFPSPQKGQTHIAPVSDQAIENVMRQRQSEFGWPEPYRPHGIRTTFRSWVQEVDPSLYAVAETALNHQVGGIVERTYARNDFLEKRRALQERWEAHLLSA
ncbi:MAG: integrase arm-type DNA-binding domain-containing protein [Shimia thalassica]|uniref:tyrosine-type recombinase/integrase n=1 Tax=Shimia thalassica TaxID=1715693 RepID=UPI0032992A28